MNTYKKDFENIPSSSKLDFTIDNAIIKAKKHKKLVHLSKLLSSISVLFILFTLGINFNTFFANSLNNLPLLSSLEKALNFHYDKNLMTKIKENTSPSVNLSSSDKNITLTINKTIGDNKDVFILYTLKSNNKKLLLSNFTLEAPKGKVIFDSKNFKSKIKPTILENNKEISFVSSDNGYKAVVTSLNYSKAKSETYGSMELISLNNTNKRIPKNIILKVSTIKNNTSSIDGAWNIPLTLQKNSEKPKEYNNIKFSANNTDCIINYLRIYPTHMDMNIKLGINKISKSQAWGIGTNTTNYKTLPFFKDDIGNIYKLSPANFSYDYKNKTVTVSFQSCYYKKVKKLYFVISQLNYENIPYVNFSPVKVYIK
ncbi:DUF4179 domain-containing protein [Clostridium felsineum]|uniref:DUF4179 domain-containing protein n=1 Tax=Clostridium felsineum TaxID=36839 RepID=UPI00098CE235|nr:DUF4179 domain-containing protein [Clostridium felsineum]URZ18709.1 hypothetical protein CLFE_047970 [Clostridium felsineum DSM 794]